MGSGAERRFLGQSPAGSSPGAGERRGSLWRGPPLSLPLTKCTAVGCTVDLDTVADNHQVGVHLRAFVRLHLDALAMLVDRQRLQVAHPLTCQGRLVDQEAGRGQCVSKAEAQARAGLTAGHQCALKP